MNVKKYLFTLCVFMASLFLFSFVANSDFEKVEALPKQEETTTIIEIPPIVDTTPSPVTPPEKDYIFYDVPFDMDTQKEIIEICSEYDISYELILGMISVESTFKSNNIGDGGDSFGLMQIQPKWWYEIMEREGVTDLLNPFQNIRCGCAIVRELKNTYGTEYRALQAYNTGNPDSNNGYAEKVYRHIDALVVLEAKT